MSLRRISGDIGLPVVECINKNLKKFRIRYDIRPEYEDGVEKGISFYELEYLGKRTIEEVKSAIIAGYNEIVDYKILSGFVWRGKPIWLSIENQFNYKAAYDFAIQTNGANLPIKFKFGTVENPSYHIFYTIEELNDFYLSAMTYINSTLEAGWKEKDSIDWSLYETALDNANRF